MLIVVLMFSLQPQCRHRHQLLTGGMDYSRFFDECEPVSGIDDTKESLNQNTQSSFPNHIFATYLLEQTFCVDKFSMALYRGHVLDPSDARGVK